MPQQVIVVVPFNRDVEVRLGPGGVVLAPVEIVATARTTMVATRAAEARKPDPVGVFDRASS
jgi:hypothetical protein